MSFKERVRQWLAIPKILELFSINLKDWMELQLSEIASAINETNSKVRALMGAGSDVEEAISQLDDANSKLHQEHLDRFDVLRDAIQDTKQESMGLRSTISNQNTQIAQMEQRIEHLENPGYKPIG